MTDLPDSTPLDPTDAPLLTARRWRWLRGLLWGVGLFWLLVGVSWMALHALILPRIDDHRAWLQTQASQRLAAPVQIGALVVQGNWLMPWIEARDVILRDRQGQTALHLPRVVAAFTPWSLMRGALQQVLIDQPMLEVKRDAQGDVWVAGLRVQSQDEGDTAVADWLFSQPEVVIQHGRIEWRDERLHGQAPMALHLDDVRLVLRNQWHWHEMQLDATPDAAVGQRMSLRGQFTQTPLHRRGDWQDWSGQAFLELPSVDVAALRNWIRWDGGLSVQQGKGRLRVWSDIEKGVARSLWADTDLEAVTVRLGTGLAPLSLRQVKGLLGVQWRQGEIELISQNLRFDTEQGEHWPGGDWRVNLRGEGARNGVVQAERLDLDALAQVAQRLPLPEAWRTPWIRLQPRGQVRQLRLTWSRADDPAAPLHYVAQGQVDQLALQRDPQGVSAHWPGLSGARVEFSLNEKEGKAKVEVRKGHLVLPVGLDDPHIDLDDAAVQLAWGAVGGRLHVTFQKGRVANADVAGEFSGHWQAGPAGATVPGTLDLQAALSRGQAQSVHRYLPNTLAVALRDYLAQSIRAGQLSKTSLRIKGDLAQLPFRDTKQGEFRLVTQISQGQYHYVPTQPKATPWPALTAVQGELVVDRQSLTFKGSTQLEGAPQVAWSKLDVQVSDYTQPHVKLTAQGRGPLAEVVQTITKSALHERTGRVLEKAQGNGLADYTLHLDLPIRQLDKAAVSGTVTFAGNDVQAIAGTPVLSQAKGVLAFDNRGFELKEVKGQMLGGDAVLQGGLRFGEADGNSSSQLRIKGVLTSEGLRRASELGFVSRVASRTKGRADYDAVVGLRRNQPELRISSDLKGMALNLPAPLNKPASTPLPLRIETQLTKESLASKSKVLQDQLRVSLGRLLAVTYVRDLSTPVPTVLQGGVAVGQPAGADWVMAPSGVALNMKWPQINLDEWNEVLSEWTGVDSVVRPLASPAPAGAKPKTADKAFATPIGGVQAAVSNAMDYVPSSAALVADEVRVSNRLMHNVVGGGTRQGDLWRINVAAEEFNGALELRPPSGNTPAQLYARLSYLVVPPSMLSEVEDMMAPQPTSIPALNVVVEDFTLRNKKLGRLELEAVNRVGPQAHNREWVLNKLNLTMPEASFVGKGNWAADGARGRRTQIQFTFHIENSGQLLTRLNMPGLVRDGRGKIEGQLTWQGSPLSLDYPSLAGKFNIGIEKGQFLKTEPGVGRLLGIFNLQALPRRLALDFSDVFYEGFVFDFFRGDVRVDKGVAYTNNLQMKGVAAAALIEGESDLAKETQNLKVVVVPEINAGNASLYMATINPLIGLTSYLAQLVLSKPLAKAGTTELRIDGTWSNPRITKVDS